MDAVRHWSHPTWELLHRLPTLAAKSDAALDAAIAAMVVVCGAMPCATCRAHTAAYFGEFPPTDLLTAAALEDYIYTLHNCIRATKRSEPFRRDVLAQYVGKAPGDVLNLVVRRFVVADGDNSVRARSVALSTVARLLAT
jgi:uncharacterized ParB-like nuclease family protein